MQSDKKVILPQLCGWERCTACTACMNSCKQGAITMQENERGELHPVIDTNLCIGCGLCERVCPEREENKSLKRNEEPVVFRCWLNDDDARKQSTSGGVAYAIAATVIKKGGHVWGAAFDNDMNPVYMEASTLEELKPIQKSKYVQCAPNDAFKNIREKLKKGELVLFAGTSCHVKGLLSFLRHKYDNLFTMDLVCHGVPGQGVFRKYKEWIEKRYQDELTGFQFRHKRSGDGQEIGYYTMATFKQRGDIKMQLGENGYFVGFQRNIFLRPCCYNCQGNGIKRYSDFTVADFWGLGKVEPFNDWRQRTRGISMLALNSDKAKSFFEEVKIMLNYEQRSIKEAYYSNHPYIHSAIKSPRAASFWAEWQTSDWEELTKKFLSMTAKDKLLYGVKRFTPPICYLMLNFWRNGSSD